MGSNGIQWWFSGDLIIWIYNKFSLMTTGRLALLWDRARVRDGHGMIRM